jgi:hypothetical protein
MARSFVSGNSMDLWLVIPQFTSGGEAIQKTVNLFVVTKKQ